MKATSVSCRTSTVEPWSTNQGCLQEIKDGTDERVCYIYLISGKTVLIIGCDQSHAGDMKGKKGRWRRDGPLNIFYGFIGHAIDA